MASADADGNVCALITSLTSGFGSLMRVPGTGVVLNNSMQNFDPRPDQANCIKPGEDAHLRARRPWSRRRTGAPCLPAAAPAAYRITTGVLHAFLNAVDFGLGPQAAIDAPPAFIARASSRPYVDPRILQEVRRRVSLAWDTRWWFRAKLQAPTPTAGSMRSRSARTA